MGGPDEKKIYKSKSLSAKRVRSDAKRSKRHDGKAKQKQVSCDPVKKSYIIGPGLIFFQSCRARRPLFWLFSANGPRTGEFV